MTGMEGQALLLIGFCAGVLSGFAGALIIMYWHGFWS